MKKKNISAPIIMIVLIIYLLIPLATTVIYSLFDNWTSFLPRDFNPENYGILFSDPGFLKALVRTVIMCILPICLTIIVVLLALFATTIYFPRLEKYVQIICMIPYTIQGVILSVSILSLYVSNPTFLSNRVVMLFGAYCIIILPHVYQGIRNGMRAVDMPMLIEAAEMLGASKLYAFFKVVVPNILSAIVVSALLAVGIIFGDYVLVRNLAGTSFPNLQIYLYQSLRQDSTKASAVFVIIMFITFVITAIVLYLKSRDGKHHVEKKAKVKE